MFNSFNVLLKTKPPSNESGGVGNCSTTVCLFVRKSGLYRTILHKGGYIKVRTKEFPHSAVSLTIADGRNDYKSRFLFCNGFFHEWPRKEAGPAMTAERKVPEKNGQKTKGIKWRRFLLNFLLRLILKIFISVENFAQMIRCH